MACIFLRAKLIDEDTRSPPLLTGGADSLAVSLDYALAKRPYWLLDMFGVSASGKSLARRLFLITNYHRKRGGPVSISLNMHTCPQHSVEVVLDGKSVENPETLRSMLQSIEECPTLSDSTPQRAALSLTMGLLPSHCQHPHSLDLVAA